MHCDFDAFFVAVGLVSEERKALRGKPVVVCHSLEGGKESTSEIASPSYEARAYGIKAGMRFVLVFFLSFSLSFLNELN